MTITDLMAYEHGADLRRAAAAYRRVHSRADRAPRPAPARRFTLLHKAPAAVGCQA